MSRSKSRSKVKPPGAAVSLNTLKLSWGFTAIPRLDAADRGERLGIGNRTDDEPEGTAGHYGSNADHVLNVAVAALVAAGVDVLFAAGNCGGPCAFPDCAPAHIGAGNGILGANSHPDVLTPGAVTVDDDLLGYSSQGPGRIARQKPDVMASSHFSGSHAAAMPSDGGTSAACGVAVGIVAALRSPPLERRPAAQAMKAALLATARQPAGVAPGWNAQTGWGMLDAAAAAALLSPPTRRHD